MSKTPTNAIWKHAFQAREGTQVVVMPKGAEVLSVQSQGNAPVMWYVCDPKAAQERRVFMMIPTGVPFGRVSGMRFIGTVQVECDESDEVYHLWELP